MTRTNITKPMLAATLALVTALNTYASSNSIEKAIREYTDSLDATIGVCAIVNGLDTISVNGDKQMPMMSVYKFPIALAVGKKCKTKNIALNKKLTVYQHDLKPDTYSPMVKKYGNLCNDSCDISIDELLRYALQQSDNNASDILLKFVGGCSSVSNYLKEIKANNISVKWSEDEMHAQPLRSLDNSASPKAMAALLDYFNTSMQDSVSLDIKSIMEGCATGTDRIQAPLMIYDIIVGHKTGTGFVYPSGRLMAINDAAYVNLPNGTHYSIVVFMSDIGMTMEQSAQVIAHISEIIFKAIQEQELDTSQRS